MLSRLSGPRLSGRWRRAPLISLGVGLVLLGGAFGAGLIQLGAPAKTTPIFSNPRAELGALTPGTVRLLPISTPDPQGGPPWGLRVLSTTRGVGCIQVGRLLDGKLGVLGQDDAFGNDGSFHELPVSGTFDQFACAALDGKGHIFNNVTEADLPASAWRGSGGVSKGCVPATASPAEKGSDITPAEKKRSGVKPPPICPQSDERNLYYGLLGPDANSITYTLAGRRHTLRTIGSEGAYLIVTKAPVHQLLDFADAGTADVVPADGPITELHYRNGATCHLTANSWIGGKSACTPALDVPVGYAAVKAPTRAQVAAPLRIRLARNREGASEVVIDFTSHVAITTDRGDYSLAVHEPHMAPRINAFFAPTRGDIAAGQTVSMRIRSFPGHPLRAGVYNGYVRLVYATGPALLEGPGTIYLPVGHFTVRVP